MTAAAGALLMLAGCHTDMWIQPKAKPLDESDFFQDRQSSRPLVAHTIARDVGLREDELRYTGFANKKLATEFPFPITRVELKRGQERFNIYCRPCHGAIGDGEGMIARRGLALRRKPGNYHTERLRKAPVGHFYDVITNGFGAMYSYAQRVEPDDRWKIAAYIRALQLSQHLPAQELTPEERQRVLEAPAQDNQPIAEPGQIGSESPLARPQLPAGEQTPR